MENKTKLILLRATPEEYLLIKKMAANFSSVSHFLRTAIAQFNDKYARENAFAVEQLYKIYKEFDNRFSWTSSNINQIAHRTNFLFNNDALTPEHMVNVCKPAIEENLQVMSELKERLSKLMDDIINKAYGNYKG